MKKIMILFAALAMMAGAADAYAEGFLVKGGLTYSNLASKNMKSFFQDFSFKNYTGWHAGIGYQTDTFGGFSFQPEFLFNVKGVKAVDMASSSMDNNVSWKMSYLELPVNIQWGINLLVARPFIFATPFVGYSVSSKLVGVDGTGKIETLVESPERFEYGLGLGAGINISKVQITAKYAWNFKGMGEIISQMQDSNTTGGFELSLAVLF